MVASTEAAITSASVGSRENSPMSFLTAPSSADDSQASTASYASGVLPRDGSNGLEVVARVAQCVMAPNHHANSRSSRGSIGEVPIEEAQHDLCLAMTAIEEDVKRTPILWSKINPVQAGQSFVSGELQATSAHAAVPGAASAAPGISFAQQPYLGPPKPIGFSTSDTSSTSSGLMIRVGSPMFPPSGASPIHHASLQPTSSWEPGQRLLPDTSTPLIPTAGSTLSHVPGYGFQHSVAQEDSSLCAVGSSSDPRGPTTSSKRQRIENYPLFSQ